MTDSILTDDKLSTEIYEEGKSWESGYWKLHSLNLSQNQDLKLTTFREEQGVLGVLFLKQAET